MGSVVCLLDVEAMLTKSWLPKGLTSEPYDATSIRQLDTKAIAVLMRVNRDKSASCNHNLFTSLGSLNFERFTHDVRD